MPRFRALKSADLEALNLGAHGQAPQLLKDLLDYCPLLVSLNLYKCYCTAPAFGIHQGGKAVVEQLLVEMRPHLANLCIQAASAGLKKMAQGLTALRSLHLMPGLGGVQRQRTPLYVLLCMCPICPTMYVR